MLASLLALTAAVSPAFAHGTYNQWTETRVYSQSAVSISQVQAYGGGCGSITGKSWLNVYNKSTGAFMFSTPHSQGSFWKCSGETQQFAYVYQPTSGRCYVARFSFTDQHGSYFGPFSGAYLCN